MGHFIALAIKNVFRQKKRSFTLGVNYAVVSFILVLLLAFSNGASRNVSTSLVRASAGHLTLSGQFAKDGKIYNGLLGVDDIVAAAREAYGESATLVTRYSVNSTVYFNGLSKRLSFSGIFVQSDSGYRSQARFLQGSWEDFVSDPNAVALPSDAAEYFGIGLGEEVVLSTRTRFGAFNTGILKVRGIYETDNYFARGRVIAHFDFLRGLDLAEEGSATTVFIYFPQATRLSARRELLAAELGERGFEVSVPKTDAEAISAISSASTRYEEDKEGRDRAMVKIATLDEVLGIVRSILAAVNAIGALIAAIMLFVIAVSIFINLRMSVNERLREIGTMRAMGVEASSVTALFVWESVGLALIFSAAGALLAVLVSLFMAVGPVFPSGGNLGLFLDGGHLVLLPGIGGVLSVVLAISAFAGLFSYLPAKRGGSIPPVEALTKTF